MEQEECRTITEELCEESQYLTVLDSYGNEVGSGTTGQNIDSYGAPLAPPLKEEGERAETTIQTPFTSFTPLPLIYQSRPRQLL